MKCRYTIDALKIDKIEIRLMVYANYISNTKDTVTYAFGGLVSDIRGIIVFDFANDRYAIEKEPEKVKAPERHIQRLYRKQRENFKRGLFNAKISYESG